MSGAGELEPSEEGNDLQGADDVATAARFARFQERGGRFAESVRERAEAVRERSAAVDLGVRVYERDRVAGGTILGSALALRLFLFFVPFVLFTVGLTGIVNQILGYDSLSSDAGISGSIGRQIDEAAAQGSAGAWFICGAGLLGMATAGYSLSRALVVSSALAWQLGGRQRTSIGVIGAIAGMISCVGLLTVLVSAIRSASGLAVASVSFAAVLGVYVVLWILTFQTLPRGTTDPGATLPGALVVSLTLTGLQAVSTLFLPRTIERSSELYGAIGVTLATLGWIYLLGRTIAFAFSLNAVVFEQIGSVSQFVFSVPGVRAIPRRYRRVARYFDLDDH